MITLSSYVGLYPLLNSIRPSAHSSRPRHLEKNLKSFAGEVRESIIIDKTLFNAAAHRTGKKPV